MTTEFFFDRQDMWVGLFWDARRRILHFCPLPCIGIRFKFRSLIASDIKAPAIHVFVKKIPAEGVFEASRGPMKVMVHYDSGHVAHTVSAGASFKSGSRSTAIYSLGVATADTMFSGLAQYKEGTPLIQD